MIVLENVTKKFDDQFAIQDINLTFNKNETVVIIGASGSGKSTLLRCINNLEDITSGNILIDGEKLTAKNRNKLCFKIGMVFQQFNLFPHMSVLDNLTYGPVNISNKKIESAKKKALELLKNFGLEKKGSSYPKDLSGGQKQRVAIARAIMMNPEILFFDEPTSALDPEVVKDIIQIIADLKHKMTTVVVTHHIKFAQIIADRIIFMDKGLILADQPADEFFRNPKSHRAKLFLKNMSDLI